MTVSGRDGTRVRGSWLGSLRWHLIVWNIVALAVLLGALGVAARVTVRSFLIGSVDQQLQESLDRSPAPPPGNNDHGDHEGIDPPDGPGPEPGPSGGPPGPHEDHQGPGGGFDKRTDRGDDSTALQQSAYVRPRHFDLQGHSLQPSDPRPVWDPAGFARAKQGQRTFATVLADDGTPLRVASDPVTGRGRQVYAVIQIAHPLEDINRSIAGVDRALLALIPVGLLGAGLGGGFVTDRVLRRVRRTTQAAAKIGSGDFSARLPVAGRDEFAELAGTFNGLLGRLETAFQQQQRLLEQQRRFTADASHELKTPLTLIKGTASMTLSHSSQATEAVYRHSLREIDQAADDMAHLVQDLLLLARSDGGQMGTNRIELPVREILEGAIARTTRDNNTLIALDVEDETLSVVGNEAELTRLFSNLLENAVRHTPAAPGAIRVTAQVCGPSVRVDISDTGIGIAPEHLPHLGERFYRVDAARARTEGGTGLGLSICKSIVEAHDGTLTIESELGKGTTVHVRLPRADATAEHRTPDR